MTHLNRLALVASIVLAGLLVAHPASAQSLKPGYVITFATQLGDAFTTVRVVHHNGGRETNPAMKWMVKSPARFYGFKIGVATGLTLAAHQMAKTHPKRAFWIQTAINSIYTVVVIKNYRQVKR